MVGLKKESITNKFMSKKVWKVNKSICYNQDQMNMKIVPMYYIIFIFQSQDYFFFEHVSITHV